MSKVEELAKLLKNTHNLILHGAPGTGKTYLAKEIAKEMGCSENEIGFVQFHPSYDYTDFVEGIRPKNSETGETNGFIRQDGVFKAFCKKAIYNYDTLRTNYEEVIDNSIEKIKSKISRIKSIDKDTGKIIYEVTFRTWPKAIHNGEIENLKKFIKDKQSLDGVNQQKTQKDLYEEIDQILKSLLYEDKPCIFIIDEINRGEVSKIFGELFFSIDPSYRDTAGLVQTQYQNLVAEGDVFYDGFYIPKNVYIIGTMNDIDRSVESMDLAIRRRFSFKEITAADSAEQILTKENPTISDLDDEIIDEMKLRMANLNDAITSEEIGLSHAYQIGAAYFLKYPMYKDETEKTPFECLWDYNLEPLMQEYLRGHIDVEEKMKKLKDAYNKEKNIEI